MGEKSYLYRPVCLSCGASFEPEKMTASTAGIRSLGDRCSWCQETGYIAHIDATKNQTCVELDMAKYTA